MPGTDWTAGAGSDGQFITPTGGANRTLRSMAKGSLPSIGGIHAEGADVNNLTAAEETLALYATGMVITARGADALSDNDDGETSSRIGVIGAGRIEAPAVTGAGIIITDIPCFAAGTRILTPDGDVPVQALAAGDEVLTLRGESDAVGRVIWAGRRRVDLARHPRPDKVVPVRILAGALAVGLPEHDLLLSPDHCLFIDGHLIEAKTLVNGATIIQDDTLRQIAYHHIELERHDIILAEGVPVETYLDSGNRDMFEGSAALVLHPDFAAPESAGAMRKPGARPQPCAALALDGPVVHAARQRLLERARALGFTVTTDNDLRVRAGAETLPPRVESSPNLLLFDLAHPIRQVALLSSAGVPAHTGADPDDRRRLGVAVIGLRLLTAGGPIEVALDDPAHRGLHDREGAHRWTNGAARIALPEYIGQALLEVRLLGQAARWTSARNTSAAKG